MTKEETRLKRIHKVLNSIISCGVDGANKEKIIALMGFTYGTSRRTCLEYIKNLRLMEKIIEKGEILYENTEKQD